MRAVTVHRSELRVAERAMPEPGRGQVLVRVLRAGICGSDLHVRHHADAGADVAAEVGYPDFMRPDDEVVLGHEIIGEVAGYGPGCRARWRPGSRVVTLPLIRVDGDVHMIGLSTRAPGGFAEYVLTDEDALMPVPAGAGVDLAALTEPLAVAYHAVRMGGARRGDPVVVVGCGPIGLAVILLLRAAGIRHIVASDLAESRRELARRCGAHVVVDPAVDSPWAHLGDRPGLVRDAPAYYRAGLETMHTLRGSRLLPWRRVLRTAQRLGAGPRGPVVFECVGRPGVIEDIVAHTPVLSTIVVVGVCMGPDTFRPTMAINKELRFRFSFCYDPADFDETLHLITRGRIDPRPLISRVIGLAEVPAAFDDLATGRDAKILIDPSR